MNDRSELIDLADVTICAADSAFVELTARALTLSMAQCRFGDAILFSDVAIEGPFRNIRIHPLTSVAAYSAFCLRGMVNHIRTPFVLIVQWDGYVVNGSAWANAFRKYDYIGAAWHGVFAQGVPMVGNGGFSLRSRKLLKAVKHLPLLGGYWEDRVICHAFRSKLERESRIRYAPVGIADRFSYEFRVPEDTPFGFHGIQHMWRHSNDREFSAVAGKMDLARMDPRKTLELIRACAGNGYSNSARILYERYRALHPPLAIEMRLRGMIGADDRAASELADLERLLAA